MARATIKKYRFVKNYFLGLWWWKCDTCMAGGNGQTQGEALDAAILHLVRDHNVGIR